MFQIQQHLRPDSQATAAHTLRIFYNPVDVIYGTKVGKFTTAEDCNSAARINSWMLRQREWCVAYLYIYYVYIVSADPCFALYRDVLMAKNDAPSGMLFDERYGSRLRRFLFKTGLMFKSQIKNSCCVFIYYYLRNNISVMWIMILLLVSWKLAKSHILGQQLHFELST